MTTQLRVSDISAASPDMEQAQFDELVDDIRKHGQLVPIWKSGDEIIDGRKRARACSILGIPLKAIDVSDENDPAALSHSLNILRTHYTQSQRTLYAAKRATWKKEWGAKSVVGISKFTDAKTAEEAAKEVGVSTSAVTHTKQILRDAAPEVVAAIESGKLTIHSAKQIIDNVPKPEQANAVIEKLNLPKRKDGRVFVKRTTPNRMTRRPLDYRMTRCLDQLENAITLFGQFLDEPGAEGHYERDNWIKSLYKMRTAISKILNSHGGSNE